MSESTNLEQAVPQGRGSLDPGHHGVVGLVLDGSPPQCIYQDIKDTSLLFNPLFWSLLFLTDIVTTFQEAITHTKLSVEFQ